jgi:mRNA interferase MazF
MVDFEPTRGHEQGGVRPALVVSEDILNRGPALLVVVVPITSRAKNVRSHVRVEPPEAGLSLTSYIKTEDVRSVSHERLVRRMGVASAQTLSDVEYRLRIILGL